MKEGGVVADGGGVRLVTGRDVEKKSMRLLVQCCG
jgi:hypothetical protein